MIDTVQDAIQWLRDVAEAEPSHPRAPFYREAAGDLEERAGPKIESAAELAARLGFKPHGRPPSL